MTISSSKSTLKRVLTKAQTHGGSCAEALQDAPYTHQVKAAGVHARSAVVKKSDGSPRCKNLGTLGPAWLSMSRQSISDSIGFDPAATRVATIQTAASNMSSFISRPSR